MLKRRNRVSVNAVLSLQVQAPIELNSLVRVAVAFEPSRAAGHNMIENEKTVAVASYFVTVFTAALFMALVGRYGLHLY